MATRSDVDAHVGQSKRWPEEVAALRPILLGCGLTEAVKWNKPCYCHEGRNIAIVQEMKDFLALMFFKGALLSDPEGLLQSQGPNTRSAMRLCFTSVAEVKAATNAVAALVAEAIDVEAAGLEVGPAPELVLADELRERLADDPALAAAFDALTPGRQREYNLYISDAKQSSTRSARIDRHVDRILAGRGLRGR